MNINKKRLFTRTIFKTHPVNIIVSKCHLLYLNQFADEAALLKNHNNNIKSQRGNSFFLLIFSFWGFNRILKDLEKIKYTYFVKL